MIKGLKVWLREEIYNTMRKEVIYRDKYQYGAAAQQADFRAALTRVQSKIDLVERQNESS